MDGKEEFVFDEWAFIERYHPNYNCDEIAWIDDICKILHNDYEPDSAAAQSEYVGMPEDELIAERNRLTAIVLREAMENYISANLPH